MAGRSLTGSLADALESRFALIAASGDMIKRTGNGKFVVAGPYFFFHFKSFCRERC